MRTLDPALKEEVANLYSQGQVSITEICKEFAIYPMTLYKILKDYSVPLRGAIGSGRGPGGLDEEQVLAFVKDYNGGMAVKELVRKYDLYGAPVVYAILDLVGVPTRSAAPENVEGRNKMITMALEMYQKGVPIWQIERDTGVRQPTLHNEIHKRGIKMRYDKGVLS